MRTITRTGLLRKLENAHPAERAVIYRELRSGMLKVIEGPGDNPPGKPRWKSANPASNRGPNPTPANGETDFTREGIETGNDVPGDVNGDVNK